MEKVKQFQADFIKNYFSKWVKYKERKLIKKMDKETIGSVSGLSFKIANNKLPPIITKEKR